MISSSNPSDAERSVPLDVAASDSQERSGPELTPVQRAAKRQRLAEVFGEVLPEQTRDDAGPQVDPVENDEWLRRQVPPHHGQ